MKLRLLLVLFCYMLTNLAYSQLSTRENDPSTYKVGTRPLAGDLGVFVSFGRNELNQLGQLFSGSQNNLEVNTFSLVNGRYYLQNDLVLRVGYVSRKEKKVASGDGTDNNNISSLKAKVSNREYALKGGVEKHFSSSNFLDVYVGAQLMGGWARDVTLENAEFDNGDVENYKRTGNNLMYGMGAFVGLQAFVADLPLAIGVEYGTLGKGSLAKRYKVETEQAIGGSSSSQTYYTVPDSDNQLTGGNFDDFSSSTQFSDVNSREFDLQSTIRLTVNYFFSK